MKKLLVFLALTSLFATTAFAINDTGENSLGVYFDAPEFNTNCIDYAVSTPFNMFFVLANCTEEVIGGFEFAWALDPEPVGLYFILGSICPPSSLNIGDNNNLIVGIGEPYYTQAATVLVEFSMMILVPGISADIPVGPSSPASIPLNAAFVSGNSELFAMNYSTLDGTFVTLDNQGWVRPGVGTIGCPAPIAVEDASWGSVKALFN
jgi:hypothetical protein